MGIPPSEAKRLTWWEYQALVWTQNDDRADPESEPAEAPEVALVATTSKRAEAMGLTRSLH